MVEVNSRNFEVNISSEGVAGPPGPVGPIGPQGVKGDPGGWVYSGTIGDGVDLNTLTVPGTYRRATSVGSTLALNYPVESWAGYIEVIGASTASSIQRATSFYSDAGAGATHKNMWWRAQVGSVWGPWQRVEIPNTGTGSPEGVVPAGVGHRYTDLAATNGAVEWIKAAGTGNTGWRVAYGDTGVRNVASMAFAGYTLTLAQMVRIGNMVSATITLRSDVAHTSGSNVFTIPAGFRPVLAYNSSPPYTGVGPLAVQTDGIAKLWTALAVNDTRAWSMTWTTRDQWPTSLPGSAA